MAAAWQEQQAHADHAALSFDERFGLLVDSQWLARENRPIEHLHDQLGEATVVDAICHRLLHNAHRIALQGPSWRKENAHIEA